MLSRATIAAARKAMRRNRTRKSPANRSTSTFCARAISIARTTLNVSKVSASVRTALNRKAQSVLTSTSVERTPDFVANDLLASTHPDRIDANAQRKFMRFDLTGRFNFFIFYFLLQWFHWISTAHRMQSTMRGCEMRPTCVLSCRRKRSVLRMRRGLDIQPERHLGRLHRYQRMRHRTRSIRPMRRQCCVHQ